MAFNGTGTFVRIYNWVTDKTNSVPITASRMDAEQDGFATGLSNCITKDGQTTITANIPMNSKKFTGLTNGSARTDSIALGQVQDGTYTYLGTTSGAADAYVASPSPTVTAYVNTMAYRAKINATNATTTPYLQLSAIGTPASDAVIKKLDDSKAEIAVEAGDMVANGLYDFQRNSANDAWILMNPEKAYVSDVENFVKSTTSVYGVSYLPNPITISNGTDSDHDIDFTAGNFNFFDGSGQAKMTAKTGELDALFGTGDGMLDTGTIAIDSTYHLFTVYNPTTGDSKPLASLSATAPTMTLPDADGYTVLGDRLGSITTDGSANIDSRYFSKVTPQGQFSKFQTGDYGSGTTQIPFDNSIPQNTEGTEYMSLKFTPLSADSTLEITVVFQNGGTNAGSNNTVALFQDSGADAIAAACDTLPTGGNVMTTAFSHKMTSGSTAEKEFKVRMGGTGGTYYFNGYAGAKLGGVIASSITINEIL